MEMSFKNGSMINIPDDVSAVFSSVSEGSTQAEGVGCGDKKRVGGLIIGIIKAFYKDLDDNEKRQFAHAAFKIFQDNPAEGMVFQTVIMRREEADDD